MTSQRRLKICYLVPGHDLMASVGPSRNVVNLAQALSQWADVTIAFRRVADRELPAGLRVLEIQPQATAATLDDAALRGIGYGAFMSYLKALHDFEARELGAFDVVLEKSWLLSGYMSARRLARGQLSVPIENIVASPKHAAGQSLAKRLRLQISRWIAGRSLRRAPLIIAETPFLRNEIVRYWQVRPECVEVVDLGVDRALFRSRDRVEARAALSIDTQSTVLLYVGVLDRTHDLGALLEALAAKPRAGLVLHLVGEGVRRADYEAMVERDKLPVVFHGRVPHEAVPGFIAAADLCIAPYDASAFSSGELGYSTMKIPEYLSVGRPVVSVPSGRIRTLITEGETGFLFANEVARWTDFLERMPSRERLHAMGDAAARTSLPSWSDTARRYLDLCVQHLDPRRPGGT